MAKTALSKVRTKETAVRAKTFLKNEYNVSGGKNVDHHLTDSGFESFERYSGLKYRKIKSRASIIKSESKFVPFDVSFVGGKFNLNIFRLKVSCTLNCVIRTTDPFNPNRRTRNVIHCFR